MYECHLTYENAVNGQYTIDLLKTYAQAHGWRYSAIDGDPLLGGGVKLYLTCHDEDVQSIFRKMREATQNRSMPKPLREKIEHIVHDPLYGVELRKDRR